MRILLEIILAVNVFSVFANDMAKAYVSLAVCAAIIIVLIYDKRCDEINDVKALAFFDDDDSSSAQTAMIAAGVRRDENSDRFMIQNGEVVLISKKGVHLLSIIKKLD